MQGAVRDVKSRRKIQGARQLGRDAKNLRSRRSSALAQKGVERIGGDEVLCQVCRGASDAGGKWNGDARVREIRRDEPIELSHQLMHALGRYVEPKHLHGDEPILVGFVRTKHWTERPCPNLMKNTKRTKRVGRRSSGSFRVQ